MASRYDHLNKEELLRLLEARDQRDATRFGLVWEANENKREFNRNLGIGRGTQIPKSRCNNIGD